MSLSSLKYKDEQPLKTINKIRSILGELGLLTVETVWRNSVEGFYSVSVAVEGTDLSTNGKGTTQQYALASAYGELMERLQNQATYRLSLDLKPETLAYKGFFYAPDEKMLSLDEVLTSNEDWISSQFSRLAPAVDRQNLLKQWQSVSYEEVPADFVALPYCNLNTKRISHIPIKMISKMYMSNGMCAGNTPEEAIVQGLSEILERNVNQRIIREKLVPPTIPRQYLANIPKIEAMVAAIEASGPFEVILKDCSLGGKFPVVGVIYINTEDQSYFVKFGAHPVFEIAAERTLTELLQGQDVRRMMGVREFAYRVDAGGAENMMGILVNGSGVYPSEFFSRSSSYEFSEFPAVRVDSNKDMLNYLVKLLAQYGRDVYVRDVSFLGFPSYHVIVPGLSEIEEISDTKAIGDYADFNEFKRLVRRLPTLSPEDSEKIIRFLRSINCGPDTTVMDVMNLPVCGNTFPWYYTNVGLFITALYYWRGDLVNAYESFCSFLQYNIPGPGNKAVMTYYKCVRDYLGTRLDGMAEQEAASLLAAFYPAGVVKGVFSEFGDPQRIISYQGQLHCWQCDTCRFKDQCLYEPTERAYKIFKERYAVSCIDQNNLKKLLEA